MNVHVRVVVVDVVDVIVVIVVAACWYCCQCSYSIRQQIDRCHVMCVLIIVVLR